MVVFRLELQVSEYWIVQPLSSSYKRITESQSSTKRSYVQVGAMLLVGSVSFMLIAAMLSIWNRRKRKDSPQ